MQVNASKIIQNQSKDYSLNSSLQEDKVIGRFASNDHLDAKRNKDIKVLKKNLQKVSYQQRALSRVNNPV